MLDSGGGTGGNGGTNWANMSMIDMWMTLQNQDTTPHWQLVDGWRRSYELTLQHMSAVRNYRENLATAWPPEKSAAAAAYVARLDELLGHLQETYDAAIANHSALSSATLSISASRTDLEKVVTEYLANEAKLVDYEQDLKVAAMPVGAKGPAARPTPKNPVPGGRQTELEARARAIMSSLSVDLVQAKTQLRQPKEYVPFKRVNQNSEDLDNPYGAAPPIPPVVAFDPGLANGAGHSASASALGQFSQPSAPQSGTGRLPGLVLGGTTQPVVTAPPPPPTIAPPVGTGPVTPLPPIPAGLSNPASGPGSRGLPPQGRTAAGPVRIGSPGGIIGEIPSQPGVNGRPISSVSPVGGVINPGSPAGSKPPAGRATTMAGQPIGAVPRQGGESDSSTQRWDPDNPWATATGVSPILEPQPEPPIDPGPAIGLD
ncbi:hypothetical protein [Actinoplanes sp. NBRC 103695]|uniref:hypothetical protein n=1 Tax=Actinoplanes sp. NBRC 103695 TaxID=3032202 RepID=UPI0024A1144E|nr:hypothetical protein [Actinoplanes sp. NBRC 103695]GLY95644.1 hypothetical protein Acsp02_28990 [Actinoplanes sp. NBRC 103695]